MEKRPNILFFFTDQQRADTVGCYGQKLATTPRLDRLAAEGVRFEYAFSCQPLCGPVRAALQTGRYPSELLCQCNHRMLPPDTPTIARALRQAGYEPAYIGKWHLASTGPHGGADDFTVSAVPPERRGGYDGFWLAADLLECTSQPFGGHLFDAAGNRRELPPDRYRVDAQTDRVLEYLDARESDAPFFLFVSYLEPHQQNELDSCVAPPEYREKFRKFEAPGDLAEAAGNWRENYPDYLGAVNKLDENFGRILDRLEERGELENTVVIFTSDHGCHFKTRNERYKMSCHESSIRIPLVIAGPGFRGGIVRGEPASLIDLPPTILRCAGIPVPEFMTGIPLSADEPFPRDDVYVQISGSGCGRCVRTAHWKYSVRAPYERPDAACGAIYVEEFLYRLDDDPGEQNNLVADPSEPCVSARRELRGRLLDWMRRTGEPIPQIREASFQSR